MMSNRFAIIMICLSIIPLGISLQAVFFSGTEVQTYTLDGREGKTEAVSVSPDMNPLRLLINLDYGMRSLSVSQRHIRYEVTAKDKMGMFIWSESGRVSVTGDKKVTGNQTHYSSIQTFDVEAPEELEFQYQIIPKNLRYKGGELVLKRNVSRHNWLITIIGIIVLVAGILIYVSNQRK